jgi:hypothetical protein
MPKFCERHIAVSLVSTLDGAAGARAYNFWGYFAIGARERHPAARPGSYQRLAPARAGSIAQAVSFNR